MPNSRRIARELALKVLFQVDVGKQPLEEVLDGALDQLRLTVNHPVSQVYGEAQEAISQVHRSQDSGMSTQSKRQVSVAARAVLNELRALQERVEEVVRQTVAERPRSDAEAAQRLVHEAVLRAVEEIGRAAERPSLQETALRALGDVADRRARSVEAIFGRHIRPAERTAAFVVRLVHGATDHQADIDARVAALSSEWALDRQPAVDRNILRLAAYEVLYEPAIPAGASINEAVELAKKYSTAESGRFVNGVLGALAGAAPEKSAAQEEEPEEIALEPSPDEVQSA